MAYDSKTYGQSPFGKATKPENSPSAKSGTAKRSVNNGQEQTAEERDLASQIPTLAVSPAHKASPQPGTRKSSSSATTSKTSSSKRKSTTASNRKSKKAKSMTKAEAAAAAIAAAEAAEAEVARRFEEEDHRAYLSLLQKTGISGLVWAVLRLSRYELPQGAIAIVNFIIHPLVISVLALIAIFGLTVWLRHLLNDLARHTQQLQSDAEASDDKSYRPTLEIVGDSLEYNPKLRKQFARLFSMASLLVCTLVSYLLVIGLTLAWQIK